MTTPSKLLSGAVRGAARLEVLLLFAALVLRATVLAVFLGVVPGSLTAAGRAVFVFLGVVMSGFLYQ